MRSTPIRRSVDSQLHEHDWTWQAKGSEIVGYDPSSGNIVVWKLDATGPLKRAEGDPDAPQPPAKFIQQAKRAHENTLSKGMSSASIRRLVESLIPEGYGTRSVDRDTALGAIRQHQLRPTSYSPELGRHASGSSFAARTAQHFEMSDEDPPRVVARLDDPRGPKGPHSGWVEYTKESLVPSLTEAQPDRDFSTPAERLFIGNFPEGLVYADRSREEHGDYKRCAFLGFKDLELDLEPDCPEDLKELILKDAASMQARKGKWYQTSSSGQGITLGYALPGTGEATPPKKNRGSMEALDPKQFAASMLEDEAPTARMRGSEPIPPETIAKAQKIAKKDPAWWRPEEIPAQGIPIVTTSTSVVKEGNKGWIIAGEERLVHLGPDDAMRAEKLPEFTLLFPSGMVVLGQYGRDFVFDETPGD